MHQIYLEKEHRGQRDVSKAAMETFIKQVYDRSKGGHPMAETGKIPEMLSELVHFSRTKISNAIGISGPLDSFLSKSSGMLACIS